MWSVPTLYYKHNLSGLVASATTSGFPVANILDRLEGTWWKGVGTGDHTITFDAGAGRSIGADYIGVANHNLAGSTFQLQYSSDDFAADINDAFTELQSFFPTTDFDVAALQPQDVAYHPNGTLWVVDATTDKAYNITKTGVWISEFSTSGFGSNQPTGITISSDGSLWICDQASETIYNVSTTGVVIDSFLSSVFDSGAIEMTGISFDSIFLKLWVTDSTTKTIYNIDLDGKLISKFPTSDILPGINLPQSIEHLPNNTLYIVDITTNTIYHTEIDGNLINSFPTSVFDGSATTTTGISISLDGSLWICDNNTNKIYNIEPTIPINNKPFLREFDLVSARYWRISLTDLSSAPFIGMAYWGQKVETDYATASFDPNNEEEEANINESQTGVLLGVHERFIRRAYNFRHDDSDNELYLKLKSCKDEVRLLNFFALWEKTEHPSDVHLVRFKPKTFKAPFVRGGLYRNISYGLIGRKEE